ncbi:universal stress protein [Methanosarcina sp.]|uniref:universal stress protein n=1 Tax=Methanosarcina sp. TaxID=2213 RepID=UPI002ABAB7EC|nr:universal stress protein [Methanosarcina sp.]MDY9927176.1 universal stress protein [Methanosarcina sp.]
MISTNGSELVRITVDTAIETSQMGEKKLYAVYVVLLGDYFSPMLLSIDRGWIKAMEENIRIEGEEAIAYVENAGRAANVEIDPMILEGNPANKIVDFAEKNDITILALSLWTHMEKLESIDSELGM